MTASLFTADDALFFSLEMADMTNDQLITLARAEYHTAPMGKVRAMSAELQERLGWDKARAVLGTAHVAA